jgi:hypothetical protein
MEIMGVAVTTFRLIDGAVGLMGVGCLEYSMAAVGFTSDGNFTSWFIMGVGAAS